MHNNRNNMDGPAGLEARLEQALEGVTVRTDGDAPENVDRRVLALIDAKVGQIRRQRTGPPLLRLVAWRWAAAAVICFGLALVTLRTLQGTRQRGMAVAAPTRSRQVDIVDAYRLAFRLRAGGTLGSDWDCNGDGRVDARDVEALAKQAVALSPERG